MAIRAEYSQIQLVLRKMVGVNFQTGTAYGGASSGIDGIDIAPFLGDSGSVRTVKAVDDPCGGFSITFADRQNDEGGDTVYALASPMDQIEIRMARIPLGFSAKCPLIMRGFISSVRRMETIAPDGTPQRLVILQGQDYGKILQNWHVYPEAQVGVGSINLLNVYNLLAAQGITVGLYTAAEWMTTFVNSIANDAVGRLAAFSGWTLEQFTPVISVPDTDGYVSSSATLQAFPGGTFWDLMDFVADRPWNELWISDNQQSETVDVIFRPVPYTDLDGNFFMPGAQDPGTIPGPPEVGGVWDVGEIVSLDCVRTDHRVANFYWTPPGTTSTATHGGSAMAQVMAQPGAADAVMGALTHNNSHQNLYGLRKMQHDTRRVPDITLPAYCPPGGRAAACALTGQFHIQRAEFLKEMNWDNSVWESVELVMKGHETLVPGKYIEWTRGQRRGEGLKTKGYIMRVAHTFVPLHSGESAAWTTTLSIERSNGYYVRDNMGASPYFAEGRRGPYNITS